MRFRYLEKNGKRYRIGLDSQGVFRVIQSLNVDSNSWETLSHEPARNDIAEGSDLGGVGPSKAPHGRVGGIYSVGPF